MGKGSPSCSSQLWDTLRLIFNIGGLLCATIAQKAGIIRRLRTAEPILAQALVLSFGGAATAAPLVTACSADSTSVSVKR